MCGFTFTVFLSLFQLIPTAPFHVRDLGGGPLASGLFLGALTFASAWSAPFTGAFADRIGRAEALIIASLGLAAFTRPTRSSRTTGCCSRSCSSTASCGRRSSSRRRRISQASCRRRDAAKASPTGAWRACSRPRRRRRWASGSTRTAGSGFAPARRLLNLIMAAIAWSMVDDRQANPQPHAHTRRQSSGTSSPCPRPCSCTPTATVR